MQCRLVARCFTPKSDLARLSCYAWKFKHTKGPEVTKREACRTPCSTCRLGRRSVSASSWLALPCAEQNMNRVVMVPLHCQHRICDRPGLFRWALVQIVMTEVSYTQAPSVSCTCVRTRVKNLRKHSSHVMCHANFFSRPRFLSTSELQRISEEQLSSRLGANIQGASIYSRMSTASQRLSFHDFACQATSPSYSSMSQAPPARNAIHSSNLPT